MRARTLLVASCLVSLAALGVACGSEDPAEPDVLAGQTKGSGGSGTASGGSGGSAGTSTAGGGAGSAGTAAGGSAGGAQAPTYPAGPFGLEENDVVQDFKFVGMRNPLAVNYETDGTTEEIAFHDFYNPDHADAAKPKVLVVTASARWCTFCKQEAASSMKHYAYWNPKGVEFLVTIFEDDANPPKPATFVDLELWTKAYKLSYPSALDPSLKLGVFFQASAAPFNMVVDTSTMKILFKTEGLVDFGESNPTLKAAVGG